MRSIDYFISSATAHLYNTPSYNAYSEQLVLLSALGYYFHRPNIVNISTEAMVNRNDDYYLTLQSMLSDTSYLGDIIERKRNESIKLVLCPQHLPKFHPLFDEVLKGVLNAGENVYLVLLVNDKKCMWRATLMQRWHLSLGSSLSKRIIWLSYLTPHDYLLMLAAGDVMIDTFPFGGGVTSLEALSVLTPIVTLPDLQTTPALTASMLLKLPTSVSNTLIVHSVQEYIETMTRIVQNDIVLLELRKSLAVAVDRIYEDKQSIVEWERFFQRL
jgi:hypothetical protein